MPVGANSGDVQGVAGLENRPPWERAVTFYKCLCKMSMERLPGVAGLENRPPCERAVTWLRRCLPWERTGGCCGPRRPALSAGQCAAGGSCWSAPDEGAWNVCVKCLWSAFKIGIDRQKCAVTCKQNCAVLRAHAKSCVMRMQIAVSWAMCMQIAARLLPLHSAENAGGSG